jgi:hypothetical protein
MAALVLIMVMALTLAVCGFSLRVLWKSRKWLLLGALLASILLLWWGIHYRVLLSNSAVVTKDRHWHIIYMDLLILFSSLSAVAWAFSGLYLHHRQYLRQYE